MEMYFKELIKIYQNKLKNVEVPVAALIIDKEGKIVSKGWNSRETKASISAHAEIEAINKLFKKTKSKNLSEYEMIVTLEPCLMCVGAIEQSSIKKVTYFLDSPKFGAKDKTNKIVFEKNNNENMNKYFSDYLREFFKKLR